MIVFDKVFFQYSASGKCSVILHDFSGSFDTGVINAILGPSGCGKSSFLKLLAGFKKPVGAEFSGQILIGGSNSSAGGNNPLVGGNNSSIDETNLIIDGKSPAKYLQTGQTAFVFQSPVLMPWLTVKQNILLPFKIMKKKVDNALIDRLIGLLDLKNFLDYYPPALSGGTRQRVNLARALVQDADLLLLDEPFKGFDPAFKQTIIAPVRQLIKERKQTCFFVTHQIEEAMMLADFLYVVSRNPLNICEKIVNSSGYSSDFNSAAVKEVFGQVMGRLQA